MKKFFQIFFMVLGVIFFLIIVAGAIFYITDPYELKPLVKSLTGQTSTPTTQTQDTSNDKNSLLSPAQESVLEKIGVDASSLPTEITPSMEQCFYEKLGEKRAEEIKNGSEPTVADFFTARACLE